MATKALRTTTLLANMPRQYGLGQLDGGKIIANCLRLHMDQNPDDVIMEVDIKNAYGSITRDAIQQGILKYCPELLSTFRAAYGKPVAIHVDTSKGLETIKMNEGIMQGDALSPLYFCMGLQRVLDERVYVPWGR